MSVRMTTQTPVLAAALWPVEGQQARWMRAVVLVLLGVALMTVCAKIQVPFWPVPLTMQTFGVLIIGAGFGWRLGGASIFAYLAAGAAGLPVFAGPVAGPGYLAGPTGGYLIGFLLAGLAMGWLVERGWDRPLPRLLAVLAVGTVVPFVPGLLWLAAYVPAGADAAIGFQRALATGLTPFIPGAVLKLALAAALLAAGWRIAARRS